MKRILIIIILIFTCSGNLFSQFFGSPDSKWVYDFTGGNAPGITVVSYQKDTLINQRLVSKFTKRGFRLGRSADTFSFFLRPIFIYEKNGIVEYSMDKINFDTLFNFNAKIGQSWMIYRNYTRSLDSMRLTVLDTFRTLISGKSLFSQQFEWTHFHPTSGEYSFVDTVYEYIGGRWTYIFPFDSKDVAIDGGEGGILRCFQNDDLGIVSFYSMNQSPYEYDCDDLTWIPTFDKNDVHYSVFPNPVLDVLNIKSKSSKSSTITLVDIMGHTTLLSDLHLGLNSIDVSGLQSGYYLLIVDGAVIGKIVK